MAIPLSCIIVEDEPLAQERVMQFLAKLPYCQLLSVFDNAADALVYLKTNAVDLVFLDIHMGQFSGIELLQRGGLTSQVVIITAYDEYAIRGYELNVTDYLLKPFTFDRFVQAVEKARNHLPVFASALVPVPPAPARNFIFVKTEYRLEKLLFQEIYYIEGMRDYRKVVAAGRQIMTLQTFREFEQDIPPEIICRVHKSFMVALDKIDSVERDTILIRGAEIPISETYRKDFYRLIARPN